MQRNLVACLIGLSLALRALVPSGWMPASGGLLSIAPCPAAASPMATMDHHKGDPAGKHDSSGDQHSDCAFSPLHASAAPADAALQLAAPSRADAPLGQPLAETSLARGPPALPPPATGPPLSA